MDDKEYIAVEDLWEFIEQSANRIAILENEPTAQKSELYKLLIMGRKELLDSLSEYVATRSVQFEEIQDTDEDYNA